MYALALQLLCMSKNIFKGVKCTVRVFECLLTTSNPQTLHLEPKTIRGKPEPQALISPNTLSLSIKIAQKPFMIGSLGLKALKYESFEGKGIPEVKDRACKAATLNMHPLNPRP